MNSGGLTDIDALVIGGGIFGCHAAIFMAAAGKRVVLIEQEAQLITRASIVNQARLHAGYHYPRSIATARSSDKFVERFGREFSDCINRDFIHYYAIAERGSLTDARQFKSFCDYLSIPCERTYDHPAFNRDQLPAVFATKEYSFDPLMLAEVYRERVASYEQIKVITGSRVIQSVNRGGARSVSVQLPTGEIKEFVTALTVNATYASINSVNHLFGQANIPLMHEIAEMAFVRVGENFRLAALTVMDGPFCSLMPYGKTGLHSLSSVAYTHQRVSYGAEPVFTECQSQNPECSPSATADCSVCRYRPVSNYNKMERQLRRYLTENVALEYAHSRFTIKAKLRANHIDDGRPTEVRLLDAKAPFLCLFAGKVNNVYAMEEVLAKLF